MTVKNEFEAFTFSFTDYDGVEVKVTRQNEDGFSWPSIIKDVCRVLEKQFGYEIMEDVQIKGQKLERHYNQLFVYNFFGEDEENFPEAKSGLTD